MENGINIIIPAAGEATRLRPLTTNQSKIMVRVNGKPCLDYILEQLYKNCNSIKNIIIVDGKFDDIREYVDRVHLDKPISFVKQGELNGPHDAIRKGLECLAHNYIDDCELPLVVWLGDAIVLEDNLPFGKDFLLTKSNVEDQSLWCMWVPSFEGSKSKFINKPKNGLINLKGPDPLALVGVYGFRQTSSVLYAFHQTFNSYEISDALLEYESPFDGNLFKAVDTKKWYDIGELSTYHKTCAELMSLKSRDFNGFDYDPDFNTITKVAVNNNRDAWKRIFAEKKWYDGLQGYQKLFVPTIVEDPTSLTMVHEPGVLLSDLMLYEDVSEQFWEKIFDKIFTVIYSNFHNYGDITLENRLTFKEDCDKMWIEKSSHRLEDIPFLNINEQEILKKFWDSIYMCSRNAEPVHTMHGDLHLGNILYDIQTDTIKFLDPRGQYGNTIGIYGDNLYDWCKLAHDAYHGYNSIIANREHNQKVKLIFKQSLDDFLFTIGQPELYNTIINGGAALLYTCIPLHNDDYERQARLDRYVEEYFESTKVKTILGV